MDQNQINNQNSTPQQVPGTPPQQPATPQIHLQSKAVGSRSAEMTKRQFGNPLFQSVLLIIFLVLFVWFVLVPKNNSVSQEKAKLEVIEQQREKLRSESEELNRLISKLEQSDEEVKLLDEAIPLDARPTSTALLIDSYSKAVGMNVTQLAIEGVDKKIAAGDKTILEDEFSVNRQLIEQSISLSLTGSIDQFSNFLTLLEGSSRVIDVEELNVTTGEEAVTFRMTLKAYEYGVPSTP